MSIENTEHAFSWPRGENRAQFPWSEETNAGGEEACIALSKLRRQVLDSLDPEVQETRWACRALGELRSLYRASVAQSAQPDGRVQDLAGVFDRLRTSWTSPELRRLAAIYEQHLKPVIELHFYGSERGQLKKALKVLMMLRLLEVPYRPGSPLPSAVEADSLLASLHVLCGGVGLMRWREGDRPVYVVEADRGRFVEWVVARTTGLLGRQDRDKGVSDALWSTLFPIAECGARQERYLPPGQSGGGPVQLCGGAFPGREAVLIRRPGRGAWVLVFESPWEMDRGRRVHQAMRALPPHLSPGQVLIWMPRRPLRREAEQITCYIAAGRALRQALSQEGAGEVVCALQRSYLWASGPALEGIVDGYRDGRVIADGGTWRPGDHANSLVHLIGELVAKAEACMPVGGSASGG